MARSTDLLWFACFALSASFRHQNEHVMQVATHHYKHRQHIKGMTPPYSCGFYGGIGNTSATLRIGSTIPNDSFRTWQLKFKPYCATLRVLKGPFPALAWWDPQVQNFTCLAAIGPSSDGKLIKNTLIFTNSYANLQFASALQSGLCELDSNSKWFSMGAMWLGIGAWWTQTPNAGAGDKSISFETMQARGDAIRQTARDNIYAAACGDWHWIYGECSEDTHGHNMIIAGAIDTAATMARATESIFRKGQLNWWEEASNAKNDDLVEVRSCKGFFPESFDTKPTHFKVVHLNHEQIAFTSDCFKGAFAQSLEALPLGNK